MFRTNSTTSLQHTASVYQK